MEGGKAGATVEQNISERRGPLNYIGIQNRARKGDLFDGMLNGRTWSLPFFLYTQDITRVDCFEGYKQDLSLYCAGRG